MLGNISKIKGNIVEFDGSKEKVFHAIVFATGYKSTASTTIIQQLCNLCFNKLNLWFQNGESMLNDDGLPKQGFPNHWKGANGLYCAGFTKRGLNGIAMDAKNIANDILSDYHA
jgi:indole-3-pyruvate monooxygenase